jgi:hypothetical protein
MIFQAEVSDAAALDIASNTDPHTDANETAEYAEMALQMAAPEMLEVLRSSCLLLLIRVAQQEKAAGNKSDTAGRAVVDRMVSVIARAEGWL